MLRRTLQYSAACKQRTAVAAAEPRDVLRVTLSGASLQPLLPDRRDLQDLQELTVVVALCEELSSGKDFIPLMAKMTTVPLGGASSPDGDSTSSLHANNGSKVNFPTAASVDIPMAPDGATWVNPRLLLMVCEDAPNAQAVFGKRSGCRLSVDLELSCWQVKVWEGKGPEVAKERKQILGFIRQGSSVWCYSQQLPASVGSSCGTGSSSSSASGCQAALVRRCCGISEQVLAVDDILRKVPAISLHERQQAAHIGSITLDVRVQHVSLADQGAIPVAAAAAANGHGPAATVATVATGVPAAAAGGDAGGAQRAAGAGIGGAQHAQWKPRDGADGVAVGGAPGCRKRKSIDGPQQEPDMDACGSDPPAKRARLVGNGSMTQADITDTAGVAACASRLDGPSASCLSTQPEEGRVLYTIEYADGKRYDEVTHGHTCSLCSMRCGDIQGLLQHLEASHGTLSFSLSEHPAPPHQVAEAEAAWSDEGHHCLWFSRVMHMAQQQQQGGVAAAAGAAGAAADAAPGPPARHVRVGLNKQMWSTGGALLIEDPCFYENAKGRKKQSSWFYHRRSHPTRITDFGNPWPAEEAERQEQQQQQGASGAGTGYELPDQVKKLVSSGLSSVQAESATAAHRGSIKRKRSAPPVIYGSLGHHKGAFGGLPRAPLPNPRPASAYFHAKSAIPFKQGDFEDRGDSDDETDVEEWQTGIKRELHMSKFSLTHSERRFMMLWEFFKRQNPLFADYVVPQRCEEFVRSYRQQLVSSPFMRRCLVVHLLTLADYVLIDGGVIDRCMRLLDEAA